MKFDSETRFLSRGECEAMKGLAILSIAMHNLCHLMPIARGTNEFFFSQKFADNLWEYTHRIDGNWFLVLGSFLGQFGVQVFLFLSAYGLVQKYERGNGRGVSKWDFISHHYLKLFRLMFMGLLIAIVCGMVMDTRFMSKPLYWLSQVFMVTNVLPRPDLNIFPGPYWFLGLMVQVYVVYRLFLHHGEGKPAWQGWCYPLIFVIVTWVPQLIAGAQGHLITYLRYNFLIAGVPFAAGLLCARYVRIPRLGKAVLGVVMLFSASLFYAMQFNFHLWMYSPLFFILAFAAFVRLCGGLMKPMIWVGGLSSCIFIVHPIVRIFSYMWEDYPQVNLYVLLAGYTVVSVVASMLYRLILKYIPSPKLVSQYK